MNEIGSKERRCKDTENSTEFKQGICKQESHRTETDQFKSITRDRKGTPALRAQDVSSSEGHVGDVYMVVQAARQHQLLA